MALETVAPGAESIAVLDWDVLRSLVAAIVNNEAATESTKALAVLTLEYVAEKADSIAEIERAMKR